MPTIYLTRRELYDLVWAKPMRDAAEELGLSDVGLKKVCDRHRVPAPPQGHWNRVNAGKATKKAIFVEIDDLSLSRVHINGALSGLPEPARQTLLSAKAAMQGLKKESRLKPPPAIPENAEVHKLIALTKSALKQGTKKEKGAISVSGPGLVTVDVSPPCAPRVVSFLSMFAKALEDLGTPLSDSPQGICLSVGPDTVRFSIKELTRRVDHKPTLEEIHAEERERRKTERSGGIYWGSYGQKKYDWERQGALSFEIDGWSTNYRRSWKDGSSQTIESCLTSIVSGVRMALEADRIQREDREERENLRRISIRREELRASIKQREKNRHSFLSGIAEAIEEHAKLQKWQELLPNERQGSVGRMSLWLSEYLKALEARIGKDAIEANLAQTELFPEHDALASELASLS